MHKGTKVGIIFILSIFFPKKPLPERFLEMSVYKVGGVSAIKISKLILYCSQLALPLLCLTR